MFQDLAFAGYAIHKKSIEDFIEMLSQQRNPNDEDIQYLCAEACDINWDLVDSEERKYIEREVSRRWQNIR